MSFTKGIPKKRDITLTKAELDLLLHLVYERHVKSNITDKDYNMIYSLKEKLREESRYL